MSEANQETVLVTKEYLDSLEDSARLLQALENAGVDNWAGYSYAMEEYQNEQ
jgi:hypothetical protein